MDVVQSPSGQPRAGSDPKHRACEPLISAHLPRPVPAYSQLILSHHTSSCTSHKLDKPTSTGFLMPEPLIVTLCCPNSNPHPAACARSCPDSLPCVHTLALEPARDPLALDSLAFALIHMAGSSNSATCPQHEGVHMSEFCYGRAPGFSASEASPRSFHRLVPYAIIPSYNRAVSCAPPVRTSLDVRVI